MPRNFSQKQYRKIFSLSLPLSFFLGPHSWHMEVLRLGAESELQLPAYATATAMQDQSHVCDLHHSSRQQGIPDPLSEASDWTRILIDTSRICFHCAKKGTPRICFWFTTEHIHYPPQWWDLFDDCLFMFWLFGFGWGLLISFHLPNSPEFYGAIRIK